MPRLLAGRMLAGLMLTVLLGVSPLAAREQTDAPGVDIIGFSPDGRYFAFEQYQYDIVSDALVAAVFVVDRETNTQAAGFPFGIIPEERDGEFPAKVGGFEPNPKLLDTGDADPDLPALRKALRDAASPKLDALGIGVQGRRLAGVPLTQRAPVATGGGSVSFVIAPTLPGAIPDQQPVYAITASYEPDPADCIDAPIPERVKQVEFVVNATAPFSDPAGIGSTTTRYAWHMEKESCGAGLWIADIIAPPAGTGTSGVMVLFLASTWRPVADDAAWHAVFVSLPQQP